jgi:uncharacterized membrane protein YccC
MPAATPPSIVDIAGIRSALTRMQWRRGLRAGLAVAAAMLVCLLLHKPMGWAALGALQVTTVDNGGPYRSRLGNMLAVLGPGSLAVLLGIYAGINLPTALALTFIVCFATTLARVLSQPLAASSVFILVCYIVAFGASDHSLTNGLTSTLYFLAGGLWAAILALLLWPVDPFRPARHAVANLYATLLELSAALPLTSTEPGHQHFNEILFRARLRIEDAKSALASTPARVTVRTVRARNLTVLTETADLLLARIMRLNGLARTHSAPDLNPALAALNAWLSPPLCEIELALRQRPVDNASAFLPIGSLSIDLHRATDLTESALLHDAAFDTFLSPESRAYLASSLRDTLFHLDIAFEALRAIWTGAESRQLSQLSASLSLPQQTSPLWLDALRSNLTLRSVMFRHALRLSAVVTLDVLLMPLLHVTHGYWLAMTSIIVLRPFAGETVRRSSERVLGTVTGGILAAVLTAILPGQYSLLIVIALGSTAAIAIYAVDYAWYCFFLTPTIVLLTLPHLHDWHLAAIRTGLTFLGALIAVLAMLLLWPERESLQLPGLLARAAAADAAYLRATLAFWRTPATSQEAKTVAERSILAPARRLCGLATNDAEDTLDHALLEHAIPLNPARDRTAQLNRSALTFTTYLRRLTQTITMLAAIADQTPPDDTLLASLAYRLDAIANTLTHPPDTQPISAPVTPIPATTSPTSLVTQQLLRLHRQVTVLERATAEIVTLP